MVSYDKIKLPIWSCITFNILKKLERKLSMAWCILKLASAIIIELAKRDDIKT